MNTSVISNHRLPGENAVEFRDRRRQWNKVLKLYLQRGVPATPRPIVDRFGKVTSQKYIPGPHPSHKPREVVVRIDVTPWTDAYGIVHSQREFTVIHPGTLIRVPA